MVGLWWAYDGLMMAETIFLIIIILLDQAKATLLKAVELDCQFSDAPLALADIYERESNLEKAAEVWGWCGLHE